MARVFDLLKSLPSHVVHGDPFVLVESVQYDSRQVTEGALFVAIRGLKQDGHDFLEHAVSNGARAVVIEEATKAASLPESVTRIVVPNSRRALAWLAAAFYRNPSREMLVVGVTGTNGKTTTAHLIAAVLRQAGWRPGIIGTLGIKTAGARIESARTTPESLDLQQTLRSFLGEGLDAAVMEVSSHSLSLHRVEGCAFDVGVLTNVTQDHLDYHVNFEDYLSAKTSLFTDYAEQSAPYKSFGAVINADDPSAPHFRQACRFPVITYGLGSPEAHLKAESLALEPTGSSFVVTFDGSRNEMHIALPGRFNVYNGLAACAVGKLLSIDSEAIGRGLASVTALDGRMEIVEEGQSFLLVVDYAHTPDGVQKVLEALREITRGRLIAVFGCGGDRDRTKRPIMGGLSGSLADLSIVTSDNPRSEDPEQIIADIVRGMDASMSFEVEPDREAAIRRACCLAQPGDVVALLGKGHETYQIFQDRTIPFDDREVARAILQDLKKRDP